MANWEKLNKRFDEVLDSLTQEDWQKWDSQKEANTQQRRKELITNGQVQEKKIFVKVPLIYHEWEKGFCLFDDDLIKFYCQKSIEDNPSKISRGYLFLVTSHYGTSNKCSI